jgi:hypothetical protein
MPPEFERALAVVDEHHTAVLVTAGVLMVGLSGAGYWVRRQLRGRVDLFGRICDGAAVLIAVALSAEGMWEVATEKMGFDPAKAILLFAFAELAMARSARRARAKVEKGKTPGIYGVMVWTIALGAGLTAATNAPNVAELLVRFMAPALVAAQWWADLVEVLREKRGDVQEQSSWIWTPRHIGIHFGLIRPGKKDLKTVDRERRITQLTVTAHRLHHGSRRLRPLRAAKLRRLALAADPDMIATAQRQVARVHQIERLTDPTAPQAQPVDDATRDVLDGVRLITRQAADRVRAEHVHAFRPDQPRRATADQMWANELVRMPARIAARIQTTPPAPVGPVQARPAVRTSVQADTSWLDQILDQPVDQARSNPAAVVQPLTSRSIPATRTASAPRTTVRVDQDADQVPPRVVEMAKVLRRRYRGEIPARKTVMEDLGWTSAGDTSAAINLVRTERAKRATKTTTTDQTTDRDAV